MKIKRLSTGFKIAIFAISYIVFYLFIQGLGPSTYQHSHFWETVASLVGDTDLEGFILISLALINFIFAAMTYKIIVRYIEKRMDSMK